jgi:DNA helicase-2/ATP-dependent DNA helicase PcrA
MLYLEGPLGSGKTTRLLDEAKQLLCRHPSSSVLVLCSNAPRQHAFIERLLKSINAPLSQLPVYTYAGFVRNTLFDFWPLVEAEIVATLKNPCTRIRPELSGLEDSEFILKWLLARLRQEAALKGQTVFEDFPGNDQHILKQIVRRLRLRSENQLTRTEMANRSQLLNEMCLKEVTWLERQFDAESYRLRVLDPNKQLDIFNSLLKKENPLSNWLKKHIRHLIVDDVDETIAAEQRLIEFLAPTLDTLILAADLDGGSRRGYLNAYPYDWERLKRLRPGKTLQMERKDAAYQTGQALLDNWKQTEDFKPLSPFVQLHDRFITRVEMLEQAVDDILGLLEAGYHPGELCLVLPKTDLLSFYQLQARLHQRGIPVQLLSGTKRPSDNPKCKAFLALLQWANAHHWKRSLSRWEIKTILTQVLLLNRLPEMGGETIDTLVCAIADYGKLHEKPEGSLLSALPLALPAGDLPVNLPELARQRYTLLSQWLEEARYLSFEEQLYSAFARLLTRFSTERDAYSDLNRIIQSYLRQKEIFEGLTRSNASNHWLRDLDGFNRWWLEQVKSGTMADTPERPEAIHPEALVIGTPQKIIDNELSRKVQFWLDVGSREWARSDNAPLYNAWVHSAVWDGSTAAFTEEFNEAVIRTRAGHITRTLMLLAQEQVRAYASELDDLGFTQIGLLKPRLLMESTQANSGPLQRATLREDQAPILKYRSGTMSISAVPGAGKTFVNVELLLELIERGIEPDRILVLTYMDSAAKTLLGRLKKKLAGITSKLPVVSTIHSLAYRILTENDHAVLAGFLPDDMTILDDYGRADVLGQVAAVTQPESAKSVGDWQRAIDRGVSHAKTFGLTTEAIQAQLNARQGGFRLAKFLPAMALYQKIMHEHGYLDFTDLITKAVDILRQYPDIREKYQRQFAYIIEDEAQDSSRLLQEFIRLLGGQTPNLIRTGDTNQSITTTFSSADTSVFRDFIQSAAHRVQMDFSGRCAPEIIDLANAWIEFARTLPDLENAFEPVQMRPVPGQNPALLFPPETKRFELDAQEQDWLVERIRKIREEKPGVSIAVLVRRNEQVNRIAALLHKAQIPAVSLTDQLNANPIFSFILAYLKLLLSPGDMALQKHWLRLMQEARLYEPSAAQREILEAAPLFYQNPVTLADETLKQWVYDWQDFSRQASGSNISTLIARLTDRFFESVADKSNGYLCALMAQDILNRFKETIHLSPLEIVIDQFDAFQRSWRGKKSFSDVLTQHASQVVQVMNLHKSKGQEFDVVFMPFLQEEYFPHNVQRIRFDESDRLIQDLDRVITAQSSLPALSPADYEQNKKKEKIEEEARLLYVGLTRARQALYLTAHEQAMSRFNKLRRLEPAAIFHWAESRLSQTPNVALNATSTEESLDETPQTSEAAPLV